MIVQYIMLNVNKVNVLIRVIDIYDKIGNYCSPILTNIEYSIEENVCE